jgi:hypothetical protein
MFTPWAKATGVAKVPVIAMAVTVIANVLTRFITTNLPSFSSNYFNVIAIYTLKVLINPHFKNPICLRCFCLLWLMYDRRFNLH